MDFVEICNVCNEKVIIKAVKRIFKSDKICRSYCDFYFGVTFLEHSVYIYRPSFSVTYTEKLMDSQVIPLHGTKQRIRTNQQIVVVPTDVLQL